MGASPVGDRTKMLKMLEVIPKTMHANYKLPEDYKRDADLAYRREEYATAVEAYTIAIQLRPSDSSYYSSRAYCYLHLGETFTALMDAKTAIQKNPRNPEGHVVFAKSGLKMAQDAMNFTYLEESQESCKKAIKLFHYSKKAVMNVKRLKQKIKIQIKKVKSP